MSKIFVIVRHTGEYPDRREENFFATNNEEYADSLVAGFNAASKVFSEFSCEYDRFKSDYNNNYFCQQFPRKLFTRQPMPKNSFRGISEADKQNPSHRLYPAYQKWLSEYTVWEAQDKIANENYHKQLDQFMIDDKIWKENYQNAKNEFKNLHLYPKYKEVFPLCNESMYKHIQMNASYYVDEVEVI